MPIDKPYRLLGGGPVISSPGNYNDLVRPEIELEDASVTQSNLTDASITGAMLQAGIVSFDKLKTTLVVNTTRTITTAAATGRTQFDIETISAGTNPLYFASVGAESTTSAAGDTAELQVIILGNLPTGDGFNGFTSVKARYEQNLVSNGLSSGNMVWRIKIWRLELT